MSRLFNSDEEKMDFVMELENHTYGLFMLHPEYVKKLEVTRRTLPDEDGNRKSVTHAFSDVELADRKDYAARSSRYIRGLLEHQGVGSGLLDRLSDEQLYYYALGIVQA